MITNYDILLSNIWVIIITWIYLYYSVFLDNILGQSYLSFYPLFFIVERIISDVVRREKKRIFSTINLFNFSSKYTTKKNQYFFKVILEYKVICIFFSGLWHVYLTLKQSPPTKTSIMRGDMTSLGSMMLSYDAI